MIPQTNGSLSMIKLSFKLKLMTLITKLHMFSFLWENDLVFFFIVCFPFLLFLCKGIMSIQTLSLGVATPHITQFCMDIEFAHSIFKFNNPAVLSFRKSIGRGLDQTLSCLWGLTTSHVTQFLFQILTLQGQFVDLDTVFGCDDSTYNPSSAEKISLHSQF